MSKLVNTVLKEERRDNRTLLRNVCRKAIKLQNKLDKDKVESDYNLNNIKSKISTMMLDNANSFSMEGLLAIGRHKLECILDDCDNVNFVYSTIREYQNICIIIKPIIARSLRFQITVKYFNEELKCFGVNVFTIEEDEFNDFINLKDLGSVYEARIGRNKIVVSQSNEGSYIKSYFNNREVNFINTERKLV